MTDFTKITTNLLLNVKDLADWGIAGGHTTADQLRLTVEARKVEAKRLVEDQGLSQRQAAKVLGVHHSTVQADLAEKPPKNGGKSATDEPKKLETEAEILAAAKELRAERADAKRAARTEKLNELSKRNAPLPERRYTIIYADPPWQYDFDDHEYLHDQVAQQLRAPILQLLEGQ
jgi:transposase